ncbi:MAG: hypothetical protein K5865_09025 [Eubacterium sp.]|nr:hypothetical protein [Eubacterium sp.]
MSDIGQESSEQQLQLLYEAKKSGKNAFIGAEYNREIAENIPKKEEESFRQG